MQSPENPGNFNCHPNILQHLFPNSIIRFPIPTNSTNQSRNTQTESTCCQQLH